MRQAIDRVDESREPRAAAELAVGDRVEAGGLLHGHRVADRFVLKGGKRRRVDTSRRERLVALLQGPWPHQAADVVGSADHVSKHCRIDSRRRDP